MFSVYKRHDIFINCNWVVRVRKTSARVRKTSARVRKISVRVRKTSVRVRKISVRVRKTSVRVRKTSVRVRKTSVRLRKIMSGGTRKEYFSLNILGSPGQCLGVSFCPELRKSGHRRIDMNGTAQQTARNIRALSSKLRAMLRVASP
jgi:hypothetical protein